MDACREVNTVPEGVSRLTIIRGLFQDVFPDVKSFLPPLQSSIATMPPALTFARPAHHSRCRQRYCRREPDFALAVSTALPRVPTACALYPVRVSKTADKRFLPKPT